MTIRRSAFQFDLARTMIIVVLGAALVGCTSSDGGERAADSDETQLPAASVSTVAGVDDFNKAKDSSSETPSSETPTSEVAGSTTAGPTTTTVDPTVTTVDPTTTAADPTTTAVDTTVEADPLEQWLGNYHWTEFVESDVGSDQTWSHDFNFTKAEGDTLVGTYTLTGFQANVETTVLAEFNLGGDILIRHVAPVQGQTSSQPGDVLVIFHGDPDDFITSLGLIDNLVPSIAAQGSYFERT